jgi:hypothetical protein
MTSVAVGDGMAIRDVVADIIADGARSTDWCPRQGSALFKRLWSEVTLQSCNGKEDNQWTM